MSENTKKILSIEDDRFISEMYTRALRNAGYQVDDAVTGPEGLKLAESQHYDLILLDLFVPERTGFEVLDDLHEKKILKDNTKVVIITNYMQDDQTRSELEKKVDGYLIKANVVPSKLVELINELLGQ